MAADPEEEAAVAKAAERASEVRAVQGLAVMGRAGWAVATTARVAETAAAGVAAATSCGGRTAQA